MAATEMGVATSGPHRIALIIGAMKSGTTTLFEMLAQHPEIAVPTFKEPDFFSDDERYARGLGWYLGLWDWKPAVHRIALEASPAYTTFPSRPGVPLRIASVPGAEFRFIYILRNPLEQIESSIRHTLYAGWGQSLDEGIPGWMIENVSYAAQLEEYLKVFPRERCLLLTLEEFSERPEDVLRRACAFLGVDEEFPFRQTGARYNTGDVYEIGELWARVVKFGPVRAIANRLLPRTLRHRIRARLTKLPGPRASLGRYLMTDEEKASVIEQLGDDLARLQHRYGVATDRYWGVDGGARMPRSTEGRNDATAVGA